MKTRVAALRRARGWTQIELAERAGIRQATISKAETRPETCEAETFLAIAAALDVPLADLFVGPGGKGSAAELLAIFERLSAVDREALLRHAEALARSRTD